MTGKKEQSGLVPPYLSYRTLMNFVDSLKQGIPSRIDRSLLGSMAGGQQSSLLAALRYLKLTTDDGLPTEVLTNLVNSEGANRQSILKAILHTSYPFLFQDGFQLDSTTSQHFNEQFAKSGTTGDTTRKAAAFFIAAATDAGFPLSRFIIPKRGPRAGLVRQNGKAKPAARKKPKAPGAAEELPPPPSPARVSWARELLAKFPSFDPAWPDDVKAKWFDAFRDLRQMEQEEA